MSNVVALQTPAPLRARDFSKQQLALIRKTVAADCNQDEFDLFIEVAKRVGLDPFRRQVYAIVHNKKDDEKRKLTIITGIDGFRAVAARNRDYRPDDEEPVITYDDAAKDPATNPLGIVKATVKAYKLAPDGQWFPVIGTAYWAEFAPLKEEWAYDESRGKRVPTGRMSLDATSLWRKMPHVLLPKCAEAQALRRGWPEDLSGIYATEEMDRAMVDITASAAVEQHERDQRLLKINARDTIPILWEAGQPIDAVPVGQLVDRVLAYAKGAESLTQLDWFEATNKAGLNEFWALHKSDALALKKEIETVRDELSK